MSQAPHRHRRPGFSLIELLVVLAIIGLLVGLLLPAVQMVREAANRTSCANNLHQIGMACRLYEMDRGTLPPSNVMDKGASWMVVILPYMEQEPLFRQWDLTRPYYQQSDTARQTAVENYFCPSRRSRFTPPQLSVVGDYPSDCWIPGPNVPGALADYAANIGLSDL